MNVERMFKLHHLGITTPGTTSQLIAYLEKLLESLDVVEFEEYTNYKFYFDDNGLCLLYYDKIDNSVWYRFKEIIDRACLIYHIIPSITVSIFHLVCIRYFGFNFTLELGANTDVKKAEKLYENLIWK